MGGITTSTTKYSPSYNNINDFIKEKYLITHNYHETINKNNYKDKLKKYNLSEFDLKKIEPGFYCFSKKIKCIKNYYFNNDNSSIFKMASYHFDIKTNNKNEKEVKIKKKILRYTINNPYTVNETKKEGWGILFLYNSKSQTKERRKLNLSEIESIKLSMKNKLEKK